MLTADNLTVNEQLTGPHAAGVNSILPKEHGSHFFYLPIIRHSDEEVKNGLTLLPPCGQKGNSGKHIQVKIQLHFLGKYVSVYVIFERLEWLLNVPFFADNCTQTRVLNDSMFFHTVMCRVELLHSHVIEQLHVWKQD